MTILVAAAVIREAVGAALLLTRRPEGKHLAGYWELPGGKVESGEDPADAVIREVREECGLEIEVMDILDVTFHRYDDKDVLLLFYDCRVRGGDIAHIEVADHAWVTPDSLSRYPLPPPDEALVEKLVQGR